MIPALAASSWYRSTRDAAAVSPEVAERALEWLLELQGEPVPPETMQAWRRWRAAHPDHERAWRRIESVRGSLQPLASPLSAAAAQAALAPSASRNRRRALKTLALAAFAGSGAWGVREHTVWWRAWTSDYRTAVGEHRNLLLPDGTRLVLNTGSAIDLRFSDAERRVVLVTGEIFIATAAGAHAPARPFLVETAQGTALALGTRYTVRQRERDTDISVFEGAVQIQPRQRGAAALILQAGRRTRYTAQAVAASEAADEASAAWKEGFIVARGMRLDDFLAELGRYSRDALSCDPAVAGLRVSGSFPVRDARAVLAALSATLDLRVDERDAFWRGRTLRLAPAARAPG